MVSAIVCSLLNEDKRGLILGCVNSLIGYDELIVYTTTVGGTGYCESWNNAAEMARGDYLVFISDDHRLIRGSLADMCVGGTVTSPTGGGVGKGPFWGGMFCVPRDIYKTYGLYDMEYNEGIHYMDEDLYERYLINKVAMTRVNSVVVDHRDPGHTLNRVDNFQERASRNSDIFHKRWRHSQS